MAFAIDPASLIHGGFPRPAVIPLHLVDHGAFTLLTLLDPSSLVRVSIREGDMICVHGFHVAVVFTLAWVCRGWPGDNGGEAFGGDRTSWTRADTRMAFFSGWQ